MRGSSAEYKRNVLGNVCVALIGFRQSDSPAGSVKIDLHQIYASLKTVCFETSKILSPVFLIRAPMLSDDHWLPLFTQFDFVVLRQHIW